MELTVAFICLIVIGVLMLFKDPPKKFDLRYFRFRIWFPEQNYSYTEDFCMPNGPVRIFGKTYVLNLKIGVRPSMVNILGPEPEKKIHGIETLKKLIEAETDQNIQKVYAQGSGNKELMEKYPLKIN